MVNIWWTKSAVMHADSRGLELNWEIHRVCLCLAQRSSHYLSCTAHCTICSFDNACNTWHRLGSIIILLFNSTKTSRAVVTHDILNISFSITCGSRHDVPATNLYWSGYVAVNFMHAANICSTLLESQNFNTCETFACWCCSKDNVDIV
jgi:hypothetical protein